MKSTGDWKSFVQHCMAFKTPRELERFFEVVLTISEREEIPKRLAIVQELLKGEKTQREIAKSLRVSIANITRASNMIKAVPYELKTIVGVKKNAD